MRIGGGRYISTRGVAIGLPLIIGAAVFLSGIGWGLPSRVLDPFLFGSHPVWTGNQIASRIGVESQESDRAADVSANRLDRTDRAVVVNGTDAERARIVRRYRLMSYQPDEFTTFAALAQMKPSGGDFDPRMYKYGGLWIYPVGGILRVGSILHLVRLTPDATFYLEHPEAFGRFYIVARVYSAAWGLVGVLAVFLLVGRITSNGHAAAVAATCFALMPVVVNAAHEAKPHLAETVLTLLAVLTGSSYVRSGSRRLGIIASLLCGAAVGVVPSALPALIVLPGMVVLRRVLHAGAERTRAAPDSPRSQIRGGASTLCPGMGGYLLVALAVYCVTNPYVPINLLRDRAVLWSNFSNSSGFYQASARGIPNAALLIGLGMSGVLACAGAFGAVTLGLRATRVRAVSEAERSRKATGLLLAAATLPTAALFVLYAARQPADYARFALPFDVFLLVEAIVAVATFIRPAALRWASFALLVLTTAYPGLMYVAGFVRDCGRDTTRIVVARRIAELKAGGVLATREEPAPWSLPPVDLFRWTIVATPRSLAADQPFPGAQLTIGPEMDASFSDLVYPGRSTPLSWASKPFVIEPATPAR